VRELTLQPPRTQDAAEPEALERFAARLGSRAAAPCAAGGPIDSWPLGMRVLLGLGEARGGRAPLPHDDECWQLLAPAQAARLRDELIAKHDESDRAKGLHPESWLPFLVSGSGDVVCLDSETREVLEVPQDSPHRPRLAASLALWLDAASDALEQGVLVVEEDGSLRVADPVTWDRAHEETQAPSTQAPDRGRWLRSLATGSAAVGLMALMLAGRAARGRFAPAAFGLCLGAFSLSLAAWLLSRVRARQE
jgi:hypothetical protein